ncbi:putative glycosyltransferase 6 [Zea mays]|uniref:Putative glycosyltransferase 6 n=1 Tax=Zea mays TaxID=4577 RepID=A0A3L6EY88_MAIZE|nr:putative glycosyltransferase 6 [Zea mays]
MVATSEAAPLRVSASVGSKHHGGAGTRGPATRRRARDVVVFAAGVAATLLALVGTASVLDPGGRGGLVALRVPVPVPGPEDGPRTFYDDPEVSYAVAAGRRLTGWDAKRAEWLRSRGLGRRSAPERVVMVSGSQPEPCPGGAGDHLMLRFLKNKLDYCRLHGIELLYNREFLHPAMGGYWAKIPIVRAAMLAHPDAEWVWWVDSDAVFTDMDFSLPLAKYGGRNFVVYGWPDKFFVRKSWLGLNAGVFLIRNCQWSLDFMDEWARMGPAYPEEHARWGKVLRATLSDKDSDVACDQSALVYLLLNNWGRLGKKTFVETEYFFQGYWKEVVDRLDGVAARYEAVERRSPGLRRRHAEQEHLRYAGARNAALRGVVPGPAGGGEVGWRRPLITHFVGCQPCSGGRNPMYSRESCDDGMRHALGFADDQVLRAYGFRHAAPLNDSVRALPFDYPAAHARND